MHGMFKCGVALLATSVFLFCLSAMAFSQERKLFLDVEQDRVSADIRKIPLREVIKAVKEETNIEFETRLAKNTFVLNEKISLRFKNLSLRDALERILSKVNHAIMIGHDGKSVASVVLLGKPDKRLRRGRRYRRSRRR